MVNSQQTGAVTNTHTHTHTQHDVLDASTWVMWRAVVPLLADLCTYSHCYIHFMPTCISKGFYSSMVIVFLKHACQLLLN